MQGRKMGKPMRGSKRSAAADCIRRLSDLDLPHLREKEYNNCAQRRRDAKASGRQASSKKRETYLRQAGEKK